MKMRAALASLLWFVFCWTALAQSTPGLVPGQVPTPAQWNSYFGAKQDYLGVPPILQSGGVLTGKLTTTPSVAASAGLNVAVGVAPINPIAGDVWMTSAGLFFQTGNATTGPLAVFGNQRYYGCSNTISDVQGIQSAINAVAAVGPGIVWVSGICNINSSIIIGNGSGSAPSTYQGIYLIGVGNLSAFPNLGFSTPTTGPKFVWTGSGTGGIISIAGPMQGWGVQNIYMDCNSVSNSVGMDVVSAQNGDSRNLSIINCVNTGLLSTTVAPFGSFTDTNSENNSYVGLNIQVPNIASAKGIGLTGVSGATSDTDYNYFANINLIMQGGSNVASIGIALQAADTNEFHNVHYINNGSNTSAICLILDYSNNASFPSSNKFYGIDTATCAGGTQVENNSTPNSGASPNWVYIGEANSMSIPSINNLVAIGSHNYVTSPGGNNAGYDFLAPILSAWSSYTLSPTCGSATFTTNASKSKTLGKVTNITIDFTFTAIGSCTNTITVNLPNTANSNAMIPGQNSAGDGIFMVCKALATGSTASCTKSGGAAFVNGDRPIMTGVYENQ